MIDKEFTFYDECKIPKGTENILTSGEQYIIAYKTVRDICMLTDRRILLRDTRGATGKKKEFLSLPYNEIVMWETETAGIGEFSSILTLYTRIGNVTIKIGPLVNADTLFSILAGLILR